MDIAQCLQQRVALLLLVEALASCCDIARACQRFIRKRTWPSKRSDTHPLETFPIASWAAATQTCKATHVTCLFNPKSFLWRPDGPSRPRALPCALAGEVHALEGGVFRSAGALAFSFRGQLYAGLVALGLGRPLRCRQFPRWPLAGLLLPSQAPVHRCAPQHRRGELCGHPGHAFGHVHGYGQRLVLPSHSGRLRAPSQSTEGAFGLASTYPA